MVHISNHIEILRDKLNQLMAQQNDPIEIYELSTQLDNLIVQYYQQTR